MIELISKALTKFFGSKSKKDIEVLEPIKDQINEFFAAFQSLTDDELREKTQEVKKAIEAHLQAIDQQIADLHTKAEQNPDMEISEKDKLFDEIDRLEEERNKQLETVLMEVLPQAFAIIKDTARRLKENKQLVVTASFWDEQMAAKKEYVTLENGKAVWANRWKAAGTEIVWDMVHYDVQLIGGIVLHQGKIAEMATGEGKTLVATLPSFLNALAKRGVHIVTVNDYLAKRDAEWMAPIMEFHGLTVDCIDKYEPHSDGRKAAYNADITYGTNNEFGFDYLRDNMARELDDQVQRKHHYAMVDEVDSVLIDDARTPLIISGPVPRGDEHEFYDLKPRIARIVEAQRKLVSGFLNDAKKKIAEGNKEEGGLALLRAHRGYPKYKPLIKFLSEPGMKQILTKVEGQHLQDNARLMPEADKPLYFTIDEKNNLIDLTDNGLEMITKEGEDTNFFVMPDIGVQVAEIENDTTLTDEEKVRKKDLVINEYTAKSQRIHSVNQLLKAYTLFEKDVDYIIVDSKVKIVDEQTGRVMEGRRYSDGLHQALEAKENVKVEDATQTYATVTLQNYFRMYHKLAGMTGTAETEESEFFDIYKLDVVVIPTNRPIQRDDRQDKVYKTLREKYNAVAEEIQEMVRLGRPVLVGTTSVENSEVLSRMLQIRKIEHQVLNAKQHAREAEVVARAGQPGTVTIATNMAGRGTDIKLSQESKASGGLAIVGTERHESRRVDRQLRGRSGRQGDPGSSQFFVSLEDDLMRLFGSDRIARVMSSLGLEEGEVIQHSMITKSIERAQKKVEENNFAARKRLLEYDNVMNSQRDVIYKRRTNALIGERLQLDIMDAFYSVAKSLSENYQGQYQSFKLEALRLLGLATKISEDEFEKTGTEGLTSKLYREAVIHYREKNKQIKDKTWPVIEKLFHERGAIIQKIGVPFTDGIKILQIPIDLKRSFDSKCGEIINVMEQSITLAVIDNAWKEHLREMDDLKQQVQNAVHEQKDPLLIYKFEAFQLFTSFLDSINEEMISFLAKANIPVTEAEEVQEARTLPKQKEPKLQENKAESRSLVGGRRPIAQGASVPQKEVEITKPLKTEKVFGRNDRVTVRYQDGTLKEDVKYKSVEKDLEANRCVLIE